jgi:F-type H+-transporting ATPase subunit delta
MANETLARRYATAVFSLAQEGGHVELVGNDLQRLADSIYSDQTTAQFFVAPIFDRYVKERALTAAFDGKVDDVALHTVLLLVRKHRETLLRELIAQYRTLQMQARGQEPLTVTSATPLSAAELRELVERLERIYDKKFDVRASIDPAVIGGVRVSTGDRRIDGTVAGRLDEISRELFGAGNV